MRRFLATLGFAFRLTFLNKCDEWRATACRSNFTEGVLKELPESAVNVVMT